MAKSFSSALNTASVLRRPNPRHLRIVEFSSIQEWCALEALSKVLIPSLRAVRASATCNNDAVGRTWAEAERIDCFYCTLCDHYMFDLVSCILPSLTPFSFGRLAEPISFAALLLTVFHTDKLPQWA